MNSIKVMLVDDHRIVCQGLRSILTTDPIFEIVAEAYDGSSAVQMVENKHPDVVLLDLRLPDIDGISVCEKIMKIRPQTAVLMLTAFVDRDLVNACLQAGARGYLLKDAENLQLIEQVIKVVRGHAALDPRAADIVTDLVRLQTKTSDLLTNRDIEILRLISRGLTNREISSRLFLSDNTVKGYVKDILSKLGVHNRVEAVLLAKERGII